MYYVLVDSHGASLESFAEREPALRTWHALIQEDATATDEVALLRCDDVGTALERISADAALAA